ncbi:HET-domain-containing protein, partial [Rhizodiscina lignyota]
MRLLDISEPNALVLREFSPNEIPSYAILSHTWGDEEVLFQDSGSATVKRKAGYKKIEGCANQARKDGYSFIWVDTCCIDKASSAELSEAINSMFRWYQNSGVCYAYLSDVPSDDYDYVLQSKFARSRWFTRGWTLQEMIAPRELRFFSRDWKAIGTKYYLRECISSITKVDTEVLKDPKLLYFRSIARRMSWAAKRQTTRPEDMAYCLLGIFDVNMPLLYGEQEKSFKRLQEEIMKDSTDHSIFAFKGIAQNPLISEYRTHGPLAEHPFQFIECSNNAPIPSASGSPPYSMTNKGLEIEVTMMESD